jgi:hypothetical protein
VHRAPLRPLARAFSALASVVLFVGLGSVAAAAETLPAASSCSASGDIAACDADRDTIPDTVERVVCATATCASGREDRDKDGIPDWTEVVACDTARCASPTKDSIRDGIPDYARQIVCGSATCFTGNAAKNPNGVPTWASVVICGTTGCATGHEDYDADGVSDAVELAACVTPRGDLAATGAFIAIWLIAAIGLGLVATGLLLARRRHLYRAALRVEGTVL